MARIILFSMTLSALLTSCARDFEAPPPTVALSAMGPNNGFSGDPIALCGANLDQETALNQVTFGAVRANLVYTEPPTDWQLAEDDPYTCNQDQIFVRVPVLSNEGPTSIQITNPSGQSVLPDAFIYRGPGHPVAEKVQKVLHQRAGLWSLFAPPGIPAPAYGAVSQEADLISLFEPGLGLHLDFGQCAMPLSGAVAVTDLVIDIFNPDTWEVAFKIFGIRAEFQPEGGPDGEHIYELSMYAWDLDLKQLLYEKTLDPPEQVYLPSTPSDRQPFRPALVWAFPRIDEPTLHDVVVSHVDRPAVAIFPVDALDEPLVVELPDQSPHCQASPNERLGPIVDLVYDPVGQAFYVALLRSNEIWRISLDGQDVARAWPPPDPTGYDGAIDCNWNNSALALRRSHLAPAHLRLYVAGAGSGRIRAMLPGTHAGDAILEPVPFQNISLDGIPYALTTGRYDKADGLTAEHLYVATQNGLVLIDVTAYSPILLPGLQTFRRIGEIPIPSNQGGPQSLITSDNYDLIGPDTIVLADAKHDKVLFYTAGAEELLLTDITIGATLPMLASSFMGDQLFMTDALSNAIHVIDRDTGVREGQFLIAGLDEHDLMGFGSTSMAALHGLDHDLLMLPLLDMSLEHRDGEFEENNNLRFENIAFGRIEDDLPTCDLTDSDMQVETALGEEYHSMELVSWDWEGRLDVPMLVFTRNKERVAIIDADGKPTGEQIPYAARTWCLEIGPGAHPDPLLLDPDDPQCDIDPSEVTDAEILIVRAGRTTPVIARIEKHTAPGETAAYILRLLPQGQGSYLASRGVEYPIATDFAPYITDLVVVPGGSHDEPRTVVYLLLSSLGMILEVSFDTTTDTFDDAVINTGGTPTKLFTSPDGRRAYVVHPLEGRVDILRRTCDPDGTCERLATSVDVEATPADIQFDHTGRYAYVIHLFSNDVTVIE